MRVDSTVVPASEVRRLEERLRGRKILQVEIPKKALDLARAQKPRLLSPSPLP
jgi:hypothetical protein